MTPQRYVLAAIGTFLVMAQPGRGADWPRFLGPSGNGISAETGINKDWARKPPAEMWRLAMTDSGYSGPSVAGGIVYVVDHKDDDEIILALDLATGAEKWRHTFAEPGKQNHGFTRATPTVADGVVYTVSRYGTLTALDALTGNKKWSSNPVKAHGGSLPRWEIASSATVDGEKLIAIAGAENAHIVALNRKTGAEIWAGGGSDIPGYATPVVATLGGTKQYLVFTGKALTGVSAKDGKLLWRHPWETKYDVNAPAPIVVSGDRILLASGYNGRMALLKLDGSTVSTVWTNDRISLKLNSAAVVDGHIYTTIEPGYLVCMDLETGKETWRNKGDEKGFELGGLCVVDGTLIVLSGNTGNVVQVKVQPDAYRELGRINPLNSDRCWTAPIVADKKLLVRSPKDLVCLDLAP